MQRKTLHAIARFLFRHLSHVEVIGLENVPPHGGLILAANHLGRLDAPLVFAVVERDDVTALVADKYIHNPFFNWMINGVHGIWINRETADFRALRVARDYLQQGGALGVAPEGTRSRTRALIQAKTGVAYLADKAGVPVVPVAITGTEKAVSTLFRLETPAHPDPLWKAVLPATLRAPCPWLIPGTKHRRDYVPDCRIVAVRIPGRIHRSPALAGIAGILARNIASDHQVW